MTNPPRTQDDYGEEPVEAARRVLIDIGQVLGSWFEDSLVLVGGWVPGLLLTDVDEPHVGSIDVDLALDADRLQDGRYAEIVKALLATRRYVQSEQPFRLSARVDLGTGRAPVEVHVDFLKPLQRRRGRKRQRLLPDFRPLDADGCAAAFVHPQQVRLTGRTVSGAENSVRLMVASIEAFLVMKAYALAKRDKPKDAYDICYCLEHASVGIAGLAARWRENRQQRHIGEAIGHLRDKFASVASFGPQQVVAFHAAQSPELRAMQARRAFELVTRFLGLVG